MAADGPTAVSVDTIDRAALGVARLGLSEAGTNFAAKGSGGNNRAAATLNARPTGLGANCPRTERANSAVHRASVRVASLGVRKVGAGVATVLCMSGNSAAASLGTTTAGSAAFTPS